MEILKLKKHIMNTARNTPAKSIVTGLRFFAEASGLILVYALPATGTVKKQISKPNIILILSDDMGYECLGAYGSTYSTPNLDRLAEEGILFTHAYSQPLSTPSRVELMTGRYNHRNYAEFGFLNHDQQTFGNLAKEAGYRTCIAGKWQLGSNSGLPSHFGFDRYCLWQLNYGRSKSGERYADPLIEADGKLLERNPESYGPDIFENYIESFIDENKDNPFFVYWPMALVHDPFVVTPDSPDWNSTDDRYQKDNRHFAEMVTYCDKLVGKLISYLKDNDLDDNTLIMFVGDNGTSKKITTPMRDGTTVRGGKGSATENGTHVPLIAVFGDRQGNPGICSDLIDFSDFLPTLAQAMDYTNKWTAGTDGRSFLPQIEGKKGKPRKWVFCHYDSFFHGAGKPEKNAKRFIRNHTYKLYSTGKFFNVAEDPAEQHEIRPGEGTRKEEKNRRFLERELSKFPAWKAGDIPVRKVEYPELKSIVKTYNTIDTVF